VAAPQQDMNGRNFSLTGEGKVKCLLQFLIKS